MTPDPEVACPETTAEAVPEIAASQLETRAQELFEQQRRRECEIVDRLLAFILAGQALAALSIGSAPLFRGAPFESVSPDLAAALAGVSLFVGLPCLLILRRAGFALTRHALAAGQMLTWTFSPASSFFASSWPT